MSRGALSWRRLVAAGAAVALVAVAVAAAFWPVEVRHSAPFGFSLTYDARRAIAVRGGYVTANYDDFNRLDLDLRAYTAGERYDLTIHVQPAGGDAPDVRTIPLQVDAAQIWHQKAVFGNPFVAVHFDPIPDSAGARYFVWVEAGPSNRDAVWTLWSIKSYSRVPAREVLAALVDAPPEPLGAAAGRVVLILLTGGTIATAAWLLGATIGVGAGRSRRAEPAADGRLLAPPEG
jgi:hypothetical protein